MEFELRIESGIFKELREDLNEVLAKTLADMEEKKSKEAETTVKLGIELVHDIAPDFSEHRYMADSDVVRPVFNSKISSVIQTKQQKSGKIRERCELIWDAEEGIYKIRPIDNRQTYLLNDDDSNEDDPVDDYEYEEPEEFYAGKQG